MALGVCGPFAGNLWFLRFLTARRGLTKLARLRRSSLLKIAGVGVTYAAAIEAWQKPALFGHDVRWVGDMIQEDAASMPSARPTDQGP